MYRLWRTFRLADKVKNQHNESPNVIYAFVTIYHICNYISQVFTKIRFLNTQKMLQSKACKS